MMVGTTFSPDPGLYPDPTGRAERVVRFVKKLKLWEGRFAGQPFTVYPFQEAILRRIYGDDRVRTACVWIPRGNAKTTLASSLALAAFLGPEAEAGAQVVMAAADRENAGIAFKSAFEMIKQDRVLLSKVRAIESRKFLEHKKQRSILKAISTEAYSKHGMNVSFFLCDELHSMPPEEARKVIKAVTDSQVKRDKYLNIFISTPGEGTGGIAYEMWQYSHAVASGAIIDPHFAPIIFAAPEGLGYKSEDAWRAANPAIDAGFLNVEELRIKSRRIEHFPAEIADFERYHLGRWTEGAAQPWISLEQYDAAEPRKPEADLVGQRAIVAIDLSSVEDLSAVVAVFPDGTGEDRAFDVAAHFFLPESGLARKAERDRASYLRWQQEGCLTVTPGNVIDHATIVAHVVDLAQRHRVEEVVLDRWNSTAVSTALMGEGLTVSTFGQGFASMSEPVRVLKTAILAGKFRHGGNVGLRSCFANVVAEKDAAENEKFTKSKSNVRGRIDGAVASAMAIGRAIASESAKSIYDNTELRPDGFLVF